MPVTQTRLADALEEERSLFAVIRGQDVLVHHPYDSFVSSVEELIRQAADDPHVLSIKMTLYRTSGDSIIAQDLIRAAERGVQVAVLVELKARFDEQRNITWAKRLEEAGVHVVHGVVGLKTHSKCTLIVRDEPEGLRRYAHIGTGNYNSSTARLYEDFGLLTCDPQIGSDLSQLFNNLTGFSREDPYRRLVVAPRSPAAPVPRPDRPRVVVRLGRADHDEDELAGRPRADRGALLGQPGRRADRAASSAASAACCRGSPASATTSG